jgi:hypothetical protein
MGGKNGVLTGLGSWNYEGRIDEEGIIGVYTGHLLCAYGVWSRYRIVFYWRN